MADDRTPLLDQIEALGRAVDAGLITRGEAIESLAAWSEGGLTKVGAAGWLDDWKNARIFVTNTALDAEELLGKIEGDADGA